MTLKIQENEHTSAPGYQKMLHIGNSFETWKKGNIFFASEAVY